MLEKPFPFHDILDWYKKNGRHELPRRQTTDPYKIWISEIFLQQTQVERVKNYYTDVITHFPDVKSLANTSYEKFFPHYKGLGYYSRAKNMLKTAQLISKEYNRTFPHQQSILQTFPGIGPYTSQAICAFAFDQKILAFDTNIEKIFSRYYYGSRFQKITKEEKSYLQQTFKNSNISGREMNNALMDFATFIDLNEKNNINFNDYPLKNSTFFLEKWLKEIKPTKKSTNIDTKNAQIFVFLHQNHQEYYSQNFDNFTPFHLPKSSENHRHYIQEYFQKHYKLAVSVRPAHKKWTTKDCDFLWYHAQIQVGQNDFWIFPKSEKKAWEESFLG